MQRLSILLFLACLFFSLQATAQITLNREDFPRRAEFRDTFFLSSEAADVLIPSSGEGQLWDYSELMPDNMIIHDFRATATDTLLQDAVQKRNTTLFFQAFPLPTTLYLGLDESGWYDVGRATAEVSYSITSVTGGTNDTLRFPALVQDYEGRLNSIQFPMTFGDQWTESHQELTPFELTVAAFGLNQTPGTSVRTTTQTRTVVGAGEILLPRAPGEPLLSLEALLIKVEVAEIDSFFLGGGPAPATLLGAFGVSQGQTSEVTRYVFYRPGFGAPVGDINQDSRFIAFRPQSARNPTSVRDHFLPGVGYYPNPVAAGNDLVITAGRAIGNGQMELIDLQGKVLLRRAFSEEASTSMTVNLPGTLQTGLYVYRLRNTAGQLIWSGRVQVVR